MTNACPSRPFQKRPKAIMLIATGRSAADEIVDASSAAFAKFRDAGLATGILIRPQAITFRDGVPAQGAAANPRDELMRYLAATEAER